MDQTVASKSTHGEFAVNLEMTSQDKGILRALARQVAELAARPVEDEKRYLWYQHNSLAPTRPVIFCDPENGWNEIITPDQLKCQADLARVGKWLCGRRFIGGVRCAMTG